MPVMAIIRWAGGGGQNNLKIVYRTSHLTLEQLRPPGGAAECFAGREGRLDYPAWPATSLT